MSDGFNRFLQDARELYEGKHRYITTVPHNVSLCRDVYTKFYRLKERFTKESKNKTLEPREEKVLKELFDSRLIIDILEIRKIGDHVEKTRGGYPVVQLWMSTPERLVAETSAGSFFCSPIGSARRVGGEPLEVDHIKLLEEGWKKVEEALLGASNGPLTLT
jgi:hypothetical protein